MQTTFNHIFTRQCKWQNLRPLKSSRQYGRSGMDECTMYDQGAAISLYMYKYKAEDRVYAPCGPTGPRLHGVGDMGFLVCRRLPAWPEEYITPRSYWHARACDMEYQNQTTGMFGLPFISSIHFLFVYVPISVRGHRSPWGIPPTPHITTMHQNQNHRVHHLAVRQKIINRK